MAWYIYKSLTGFGQPFEIAEPPKIGERLLHRGGGASTPVDPDRVPRVFRQEKPHNRGIGQINHACGMQFVHQRFKDLVERFEPDVHLFIPITLLRKNGDKIEGPWYYFQTQQDVDCMLVDHEKGEYFIKAEEGRWRSSMGGITPTGLRKLLLSKPQIEGLHLWTGGLLGFDRLFFSDEFMAAFRKEKFISIFKPYKQSQDVDRPWTAEEQMGPLLDQWKRFEASGRTDGSVW